MILGKSGKLKIVRVPIVCAGFAQTNVFAELGRVPSMFIAKWNLAAHANPFCDFIATIALVFLWVNLMRIPVHRINLLKHRH